MVCANDENNDLCFLFAIDDRELESIDAYSSTAFLNFGAGHRVSSDSSESVFDGFVKLATDASSRAFEIADLVQQVGSGSVIQT